MTEIKTTQEWDDLAVMLKEHGYKLYQWQYGANKPEGFHVWLFASGRPIIEIVTYNEAVQRAILKYS